MMIKIVIVISEDGEIFFYTVDEESKDAMFIQPRIKKKEGETEEEEERFH